MDSVIMGEPHSMKSDVEYCEEGFVELSKRHT